MDTTPNFVQLIKLVQAEIGVGYARVRPPRLQLVGEELEQAKTIIQRALRTRPQVAASGAWLNENQHGQPLRPPQLGSTV